MALKRARRLDEAFNDFSRCLAAYEPSGAEGRSITFIALTKAFEVCMEYAWKTLRAAVEDRGLEANSPKDAVRAAAQVGLIDDPALWIDAINARNQSVHDYFSLSEEALVSLMRQFAGALQALLRGSKLPA